MQSYDQILQVDDPEKRHLLLINFLTQALSHEDAVIALAGYIMYSIDMKKIEAEIKDFVKSLAADQIAKVDALVDDYKSSLAVAESALQDNIATKEKASRRARVAAEAKHSKPGGSREKMEIIRSIWATGKYSSRDICAEQESAAIGMSFSTARKALRGTPSPT
jgi:hypothetical protein